MMSTRQRLSGASLAGVAVVAAVGALGYVAKAGDTAYAGVLSPASVTALQVSVPWRIAQVLVHPGQQVKAGQLLATQDSSVATAVVAADRADVAAIAARLAALRTAPAAAGQRLDLLAGRAAQQIAFAQQDAAQSAALLAQASARANALLTAVEHKRAEDAASEAQACGPTRSAGPGSVGQPAATGAAATGRCAPLGAELGQDAIEVIRAQDAVSEAAGQQQLAAAQAAHALAAAQTNDELVHAEQGLTVPPAAATAGDITAADADLLRVRAVLGRDQAALAALRVTSPDAGTVLAVGAAAGSYADPAGIRQPPAALVTAQSAAGSAPVASGTPTSTPAPAFQPLLTLQTGTAMHVTVQVPETDLHTFSAGRHATVAVHAAGVSGLPVRLAGVQPVSGAGKGTFAVVFVTVGASPAGILPGMTADVVLD